MRPITARFYLVCLPLLALFLGCNKTCKSSWLKKGREEQQMSPRIVEGQLKNGVKYFLMHNNKPDGRCFMRLNVAKIGSFVEEDNQSGMAHMVEHLAFDDRSLSADESLGEWLQKNGMALGPHANAFTSSEHTVYLIDLPSCEAESIKNVLRLFRSFADGLTFSDEAIAREKNIIDAEERESNYPAALLAKRLIKALYSGTPYVSRPVLGEKSIRRAFTPEMLTDFYRQWYQPGNLSVIVVGDYNRDVHLDELIVNAFEDLSAKTAAKKPPTITDPDYRTPVFILNDKDLAHVETVFSIQTKKLVKPEYRRDLLKKRIAFLLAIGMLKDAYAMQFQRGTTMRETSIDGFFLDDKIYELSLNVASRPEDFEKAFTEAFLILRQAAELGFDDQAFLMAQRTFKDALDQGIVEEATAPSDLWAQKILDQVNEMSVADSAVQYQDIAAPIVSEITKKDCKNALEEALASGHQYIFAMGAIDEAPDNVTKLAQLLKNAKAQKIDAKKAVGPVSFRYQIPYCGDFLAPTNRMEDVDVLKLSLANDTLVMLKTTSFKKDEIVIKVITDEGYTSMNQRDFTIARLVKTAWFEGGLVKHPPDEVVKLIRDKQLSVQIDIFDNRLEATINTRNSDVRFVLELMRAFITEPLYSESTINRLREQIKLHYAELEHNIATPLQNDFLKAITNNDYRAGLSTQSVLESVSREELLAWHKKYVSSKKLSVVVVGDPKPDEIIRDLNCTLGTLPMAFAAPPQKALPLKFIAGIDKTYQVNAKNEASLITVRYPLNFPGPVYPDHGLHILQDVIQEKLRLKLREKKQSAYAPSAVVMENKNPLLQNWLDVTAAAKKEEAEQTRHDIKQILNKLASKGISEKDLTKAKEPYLTEMKQALIDNSYWAAILANNFAETDSLKWVVTMMSDIKSITRQSINQLLRRYFHSKNTSSAIVNPNNR